MHLPLRFFRFGNRYQMQPKNFLKFLKSKKKVLGFSTGINSQRNRRKNSKKFFLGICTGPNTFFKKIFWLNLVPGTASKIIF
jgi:hypothetical protein